MPFITREDGEHFVIPSYRDVLTAKQKGQLKKDILLLSQSYGEYITLQKKGIMQYEVAFSPDAGYLLGESIWHYFKKPTELIYCEAIPNTTEAILVIVKAGSVYLDGSFPLDSIPEELIIFLTQENNFEIYTYGDVPISETPQEGKFSFDPKSVKSFTALNKPVFPTLPLLSVYRLKLVDAVLKAQGIGVFPTGTLLSLLFLLGLGWLGWWYFTPEKAPIVVEEKKVNPFEAYNKALSSPRPGEEIKKVLTYLIELRGMPGWHVKSVAYTKENLSVVVQSDGGKTEDLLIWAQNNKYTVSIKSEGIYLDKSIKLDSRVLPTKIYPLKQVIAAFVDKLASVYPGNNITLGKTEKKDAYSSIILEIRLSDVSPVVLALIGNQFKDLPFVLRNLSFNANEENTYSGTITVEAFGN
jgi:hypothetical protein